MYKLKKYISPEKKLTMNTLRKELLFCFFSQDFNCHIIALYEHEQSKVEQSKVEVVYML